MRALVLTLLLLGAVAAARAQTCAACEAGTLDRASRLCLPSRVEGLTSTTLPQERKVQGNSVAVGYNAMRYRLAITLQLYDRPHAGPQSDDDEMGKAVREVLDAHRGAQLEMGGPASLPVAGESPEGHGALVTWQEGLADYASLLWLFPQEKRWLKVAATYVRPAEGAGDAAEFALGYVRMLAGAICRVR